MDKLILSFFLILSLAVLAFGIYFTVFSYKNHYSIVGQKGEYNKIEQYILDHLKLMKVLGPVMIGLGAIGLIMSVMALSKGMYYPSNSPKSNFGFKFY